MNTRFIQIHALTSYPAALLNRDDAGFAKRLPFGGVTRTRISSQCLKRHWRSFSSEEGLHSLDVEMSVRSRLTFDRFILRPLLADGIREEMAKAVTAALMSAFLGESPKAKKAKESEEAPSMQTSQITVLGRPELAFLLREARALCAEVEDPKKAAGVVKERYKKETKKNLQALRAGAGLDAAMFGRMVTSDLLARTDAAIHVAHAFTVHAEESESDYFSAIDDLQQGEDGELGSGHINSQELTSGLYYSYVVVDLPLLIANLSGAAAAEATDADRELAGQVASRLLRIMATVSPGAKLGSTAPYARAHLVMVETGRAQPRSLANAFLKPVASRPDLVKNAYEALSRHLNELDEMYGQSEQRRLAGIGPVDVIAAAKRVAPGEDGALAALASWTKAQALEG